MDNAFSILVETFFGFFALFLITKFLGKTQITQLTAFDFIAALILGELVGNALFDDKAGILEIGYAVFLWGALLYVTEIVTQKFKRSRSLLEGMPSIIINKGHLQREQMKSSKLDINQLQHLLRAKGAFSINEVAYAILETDGSISVMKKSEAQTPTRKDMALQPQNPILAVTVISDGEILYDNLRESNLDEQWLDAELLKQGVKSTSDVFYAEWIEGQPLHIQPY
ncbi:DUF421 domain-containing protein [Sediminibacillus albus]|uniref:Uncharacterized membrane protein YcaP, DUF421 family n=1 Tax=Sediminibacillus albus TaxID=407036 RepID=A0A1G8X7Z0_9BACI|nr:DUF421 domain-containing protein [Sediminibacillus albus]SDJ86497.1 Uncharacterized membrane protein YcaP, DUF421 family [Sediminibacillus albus]